MTEPIVIGAAIANSDGVWVDVKPLRLSAGDWKITEGTVTLRAAARILDNGFLSVQLVQLPPEESDNENG